MNKPALRAQSLVESAVPDHLRPAVTPELADLLLNGLGVSYNPATGEMADMAKTHFLRDGQWVPRAKPLA